MAGLTEFVERRRAAWDELNLIVGRATSTGVRSLPRADLRALGPLYRRAAADLAYLRLRGGDPALIGFLNGLVTRAHGVLYAERGPGSGRLLNFLLFGFPRLVRARQVYVLLAAGLFLLGGIVGAAVTIANPENLRLFVGARADDPAFYANLEKGAEASDIMSATLMQNNIRVSILAFAVGMLGGFPTLLILFTNGLPIGALAVGQYNTGYSYAFWSFIFPHGFIELTAIFIAGAAGMMIGHALIAPGELTRRDAIALAGRDAGRMLLGVAGMLVCAGLIEGFLSPSALPRPFKLAFGILTAFGLFVYFTGLRDPKPDSVDA